MKKIFVLAVFMVFAIATMASAQMGTWALLQGTWLESGTAPGAVGNILSASQIASQYSLNGVTLSSVAAGTPPYAWHTIYLGGTGTINASVWGGNPLDIRALTFVQTIVDMEPTYYPGYGSPSPQFHSDVKISGYFTADPGTIFNITGVAVPTFFNSSPFTQGGNFLEGQITIVPEPGSLLLLGTGLLGLGLVARYRRKRS